MMTIEEAAVDRVASLRQCMRHAREDTACEGTTAEKRAERRVISCRLTPHTYFFLPDTPRTNIYPATEHGLLLNICQKLRGDLIFPQSLSKTIF